MTPSPARDTPSTRSRRREAIRARVVDQAISLFADKGYAATSPQDIADAAGLTRQSFYYYGFSKEELLLHAMEELQAQTSLRLRALIAKSTTQSASLHDLISLLVSDRAHNRARVRLLVRSESELPPSLADAYATARDEVLGLVQEVVQAGMRSGEFRTVDPYIAAQSVIGMSDSVAWWFDSNDERSVDPIAQEIAENAVRMLRI